ncbi:NUDIX domain-containing protein [Inquilinus limosus]|uniref:NUDIX domain-containing protein n=1 Tax=Inquilinus limosus TaxID=171674 RepID=UPI003F18ED1F
MAFDNDADVELIERRTEHAGFFRLDRLQLRHRRFDGGWTEPLSRELVLRRPAVGLLPYDPVADRVVLVEQFRLGAWIADRPAWMLEIPAGLIDAGESQEHSAARETREETGLEVAELLPVGEFATSPGGFNEWVSLFCGRVQAPAERSLHGLATEQEDIRILPMPAEDALALLAEGRIQNAITLIALQWFALNRDSLRRRWASLEAAEDAH